MGKSKEYPPELDFEFDYLKAAFDKTDNRLFAWIAIQNCLESNKPLPSWVQEYLLQVSRALLAIKSPGKDAQKCIPKAIQIKGNDFTSLQNEHRDEFIFQLICLEFAQVQKEGISNKNEEVFNRVVKRLEDDGIAIGFESVKRIYYAQRKMLESTMELIHEFENDAEGKPNM